MYTTSIAVDGACAADFVDFSSFICSYLSSLGILYFLRSVGKTSSGICIYTYQWQYHASFNTTYY
jgi:hypothetical protein